MGFACEDSMGLIRGLEIQALVEAATGDVCPCKQGEGCPLECGSGISRDGRGDLWVPRIRVGA